MTAIDGEDCSCAKSIVIPPLSIAEKLYINLLLLCGVLAFVTVLV